ncbi:universal stress protein UspA [Methanoculleus taiwanensis]|uniref:Universal stress protein UspA n=1 Tax=Methanoculleus taiwanensis TaxID=1550565 RepID=A0A498H008_9EURY|nr:universal stress protein [Methanoculleus taiwanensis]RXE55717.1 universal stress protein UspA [Methanoculleus taiwanensis]
MTNSKHIGTVLVPLEMAGSSDAILSAVEEIVRAGADEIQLLHVANVRDTLAAPEILDHDREVLEAWRERLIACGAPSVTVEVVSGMPSTEIIERSERDDYALIVLGSHGRNLVSRVILGSTTEDVLRHVDDPVLVVRLRIVETGDEATCRLAADRLVKRILYATDFSAYAERCIPCLSWIAGAHPEELTVVHVQDLRHLSYASKEQMAAFNRRDEERLAALKREFEAAGFANVDTVLRTGNAIDEVLALAEERGVTLIVLGAKGRHGTVEQIFGGVAEAVVHRSAGHVLVVR